MKNESMLWPKDIYQEELQHYERMVKVGSIKFDSKIHRSKVLACDEINKLEEAIKKGASLEVLEGILIFRRSIMQVLL